MASRIIRSGFMESHAKLEVRVGRTPLLPDIMRWSPTALKVSRRHKGAAPPGRQASMTSGRSQRATARAAQGWRCQHVGRDLRTFDVVAACGWNFPVKSSLGKLA